MTAISEKFMRFFETKTPTAERHYTRVVATSVLSTDLAVDIALFCEREKLSDESVDSLIGLFHRCDMESHDTTARAYQDSNA